MEMGRGKRVFLGFMKRFRCDGLLSQQIRFRIPCPPQKKKNKKMIGRIVGCFLLIFILDGGGISSRGGGRGREGGRGGGGGGGGGWMIDFYNEERWKRERRVSLRMQRLTVIHSLQPSGGRSQEGKRPVRKLGESPSFIQLVPYPNVASTVRV